MTNKIGIVIFGGFLIVALLAVRLASQVLNQDPSKHNSTKGISATVDFKFIRTNNQGETIDQGGNHVVIFDPKSPYLDFKVSLGLRHPLYAKDKAGKVKKDYVPKRFHDIIADDNAKLNGQLPFVAINADYIDTDHRPQGLNRSRGIDYSGDFSTMRSSFGISGGQPNQRQATIQKGPRKDPALNFNVVGGNGRFYQNGEFRDICDDLGEYACQREVARSMVAITSKGYVIFLVNNAAPNQELFPSMFDDVLEGIAKNNEIGTIKEGMLFDGGLSVGLYYDGKIYAENSNPIGSVFMIYRK